MHVVICDDVARCTLDAKRSRVIDFLGRQCRRAHQPVQVVLHSTVVISTIKNQRILFWPKEDEWQLHMQHCGGAVKYSRSFSCQSTHSRMSTRCLPSPRIGCHQGRCSANPCREVSSMAMQRVPVPPKPPRFAPTSRSTLRASKKQGEFFVEPLNPKFRNSRTEQEPQIKRF